MRQYFGTDGVRGPVGGPLINVDFAARLGQATARWLKANAPTQLGSLKIVIGRDTRASGEALELAIAAGFAAEGCQPLSIGVVPTPAVARCVLQQHAALGVVITASHNPSSDNGIKFFGPSGMKLTDAQEQEIEAGFPAFAVAPLSRPLPQLGNAVEEYLKVTGQILAPGSLRGWKIVLDTAHGATVGTSPRVLAELGAELVSLGAQPDGQNINEGVGSEHPEQLAALVLKEGASLGIAHDGDGDRCILCDERGVVLDGDEILAILATHALRQDKLSERTLVVTVQSNLGLDAAITEAHGLVSRTAVGDRYVIERMVALGATLGGESSGHVICSAISPTGDGLVCALKVLEVMLVTGQPLSVLRTCMHKFPQQSKALKVKQKLPLEQLPSFQAEKTLIEAELGRQGRVLIRYSGTEAKLRLLVEGPNDALVASALARLEATLREGLEVL